MTGVYQGPSPTRLVALSGLHALPTGEKVRFLGCVIKYDISTGTLTLEHKFPPGSSKEAIVDVNLVLGALCSTDTQVGEWINVMGYITVPSSTQHRDSGDKKTTVSVQAIVLWSAGSVKLNEYEDFLDGQLHII